MKAIRKRELESTTDVLEIAPIFHSQSKYIGGSREKKNFGEGGCGSQIVSPKIGWAKHAYFVRSMEM